MRPKSSGKAQRIMFFLAGLAFTVIYFYTWNSLSSMMKVGSVLLTLVMFYNAFFDEKTAIQHEKDVGTMISSLWENVIKYLVYGVLAILGIILILYIIRALFSFIFPTDITVIINK